MKFKESTDRSGWQHLYLTGVERKDVYFSNLEGAPKNNSNYAPKHAIGIWIDADIAQELMAFNCNVKSVTELERALRSGNEDRVREVEQDRRLQKELSEQIRYYIVFTAYPKMRLNVRKNANEPWPKVKLITEKKTTILDIDALRIADRTRIQECGIEFHTWEYEAGKPCVSVLDELRIVVDESSDDEDLSYLDLVYGSDDEAYADKIASSNPGSDDDIPFD